MATNRDIIVKLRLAGEEFDRDFKVKFQDLTDAAEKASEESGRKAGSNFGSSFAKGLGAAAGAAGAAMGLAINQASNLGSEIASTSRQFNVGVEALQVWRQAAATAGVSANELNGAFGSLTQKIGEANNGNRQAQQSFVDLGIGFKTTAGEARATDTVMLDLAKRIADIQDPSERVRVGTQLLGDEFKTLYPLLLDGADGLERARLELGQFGAILTQDEIRNLEKTNAKIEQMKTVLSIRIASVVAENADSIIVFTDKLVRFASSAIDAANAYLGLQSAFDRKVAGLPAGMSILDKQAAVQKIAGEEAQRSAQRRGGVPGLFELRDPTARAAAPNQDYYTSWNRDLVRQWLAPPPPSIVSPRVTGGSAGRAAGGSVARRPEKTDAEKAAEAALKAEDRMRDAVARTLQEQKDSADLATIRKIQGEKAVAVAEAELRLVRQTPGIQAQTVEELGKALGHTEAMVKERRAELELMLASNKAALETAKATAASEYDAKKVIIDLAAQKQRDDEIIRERQKWEAEYTAAVLNVANIYETAFQGGTKDLWRNFKDEGIRMIAEVAAQWTLSMIAGQPFNASQAASGAFGRSPLSSIFFGAGGAANDNGTGIPGFAGGMFGGGLPDYITGSPIIQGGGGLGGAAIRSTLGPQVAAQAKAKALQQTGFDLSLGTLAGSLVGGGGMASQLGGMVGSIGGQALGSSIGALGAFGGPVGAIVGGILGSVLPSLLSSPKRASVTVGGVGGTLGIIGRQGNSAARDQTATQGAGSLIDAIFQIADQLGGDVDASRGSVSFGMRKNSYRVDTSGGGATKIGNGAVDFGSDQEAAMRFAIGDLIKDGVITGISQASQNLIQRGGDLDKQIEKALLIEQIPKLLSERMDPLGAAVDALYDKFKLVNDALVEGSASAEQFAQARQLWELEKADAIASIGTASQTLNDFLASLNAGSNSPLSLREQREEAERQLSPFLSQISAAERARGEVDRLRGSGGSAADIAAAEQAARAAAAAIDQSGFTEASQLLLSISREANASSGAFFSDFDRIRALTGQAAGFVDQASARGADGRDPFARETAQNTKDAAFILADLSAESRAQGETLRQIAAALSGGSGGGRFFEDPRGFVNAA